MYLSGVILKNIRSENFVEITLKEETFAILRFFAKTAKVGSREKFWNI